VSKRCRYCEQEAKLRKCGEAGYPYRQDYGPVWICHPCGAYVGCHPGTEKPLGGLANAALRQLKIETHALFDPMWQAKMRKEGCSKGRARRAGYRWLAEQMGLPVKLTHIGYFNEDECRKAIAICEAIYNRRNA